METRPKKCATYLRTSHALPTRIGLIKRMSQKSLIAERYEWAASRTIGQHTLSSKGSREQSDEKIATGGEPRAGSTPASSFQIWQLNREEACCLDFGGSTAIQMRARRQQYVFVGRTGEMMGWYGARLVTGRDSALHAAKELT